MTTLSILGIILALATLVFMVYKRYGMIPTTILASIIVALFSRMDVFGTLTGAWLSGFGGYVQSWFLVFALSALFGKAMEVSGAAAAFAGIIYKYLGKRFAIYGCILATSILSYAGVSGFVIIFTVYPIFLSVMRQANIPRRYLPAMIYCSICSYSMMFPGAAAVQNFMCAAKLGTTAFAAPVLGTICGLICMALIYLYFEHEFKKARKKGEGFVTDPIDENTTVDTGKIRHAWLSIIPMATLLIALNVFNLDTNLSLMIGTATVLLLFWKNIEDKRTMFNDGLFGGTSSIVNTAATVAVGTVIKGTVGFAAVCTWVLSLPFPPIFSYGIATTVLSGVCGSGSGGLGIALETLVDQYLALGVNPELLHRVGTIACIGLDSLPHCGLVVTMISYCRMTHKDSYFPIFVTTVLITLFCLLIAMCLGVVMY